MPHLLRTLTLTLLCAFTTCGAAAKTIYLTFDDGPNKATDGVLDILAGKVKLVEGADGKVTLVPPKENEVKPPEIAATFFVTAREGNSQQKSFKRIREAKHGIGNHCFDHKLGDDAPNKANYETFYGKTEFSSPEKKAAFKLNYSKNTKHFGDLIGDTSFAFAIARLPGDGRFVKYLVDETNTLGMKHFGWDVEFAPNGTFPNREKPEKNDFKRDWKGLPVAATIGKDSLPADGNILLFHEHHWDGDKLTAFAQVIKILRENGYIFGKLSP